MNGAFYDGTKDGVNGLLDAPGVKLVVLVLMIPGAGALDVGLNSAADGLNTAASAFKAL